MPWTNGRSSIVQQPSAFLKQLLISNFKKTQSIKKADESKNYLSILNCIASRTSW